MTVPFNLSYNPMPDLVTRKAGKISKTAFSVIESIVAIVVVLALFFVLAPSVAYNMGWLIPPQRDMEVHIRDVRHPTAFRIPSISQPKQGQALNPPSQPLESQKP
jgi:hypothetical protein